MTTKTTTEIITLMWVCSHNNSNASGTSYNKKRQQCTRWGSGNIEEESSCLCPQTWLFHPRQHLCRRCLLSSTVHCDVCVCTICVFVCASLFKSHYKALVRLYLSPPRFRLNHSRFHLSHHDDRFYLENVSWWTPLQTRTNAQTYASPTSPVSSVDCRLARYLFWYLFQHWLAFTSMLMILVYVLGFLLHFPLNTRELIPLSISFTRKPRLAATQQTSDRKPTRKQTKTQANTRRKI